MFSVCDHLGDIQTSGLGEQGLFFHGTRHLSEFALCLWNARPLLFSSAIKANNFLFTANLSNPDVSKNDSVAIPRGTLHLQRSKFLWRDVSYEEFAFINYGLSSLLVPFGLRFDADFADIFEVRGMHRHRRGQRLEDRVEKDLVQLSYKGLDGTIRRTSLQCDFVPQKTTASEMQFEVHLDPGQKTVFHLTISCNCETEHDEVGYSSAIVSARGEQKTASATLPQMTSSNSRLTDWLKRSASDVQMMMIGNPETNYPYAGVPWFSTVFGRDGIITALQMLWLCPAIAKGVLQYLARMQAKDFDPATEAEPGKILPVWACLSRPNPNGFYLIVLICQREFRSFG
jgi:glycogen debranching enzyme